MQCRLLLSTTKSGYDAYRFSRTCVLALPWVVIMLSSTVLGNNPGPAKGIFSSQLLGHSTYGERSPSEAPEKYSVSPTLARSPSTCGEIFSGQSQIAMWLKFSHAEDPTSHWMRSATKYGIKSQPSASCFRWILIRACTLWSAFCAAVVARVSMSPSAEDPEIREGGNDLT